MKTEFTDVSETRKNLVVEIPTPVVEAEIERVAKNLSRAARIPGFRPGKVPTRLVRQRYRDQILHEVAHGLIPNAIEVALRERGEEPIDTPDIQDVTLEEGQPLRFTATYETVPPIEPIDYDALALRRQPATVEAADVDRALQQLRERAARFEPVEGRGVQDGDSVTVDLRREALGAEEPPAPTSHENVTVDLGAPANPPGFDAELIGMEPGQSRTFTLSYPADYANQELAGREVRYTVDLKTIRRRVVPELDDELARDLGEFESLEQLRGRVEQDLRQQAAAESDRQLRSDLLKGLAQRVSFEVPAVLVEREVDRRIEELARRLFEQGIDPRRANIDWEQFREAQREPAAEAVRGALVLDDVARREGLSVGDADIEAEVGRFAERTGQSAQAVRARLEKEGGIARMVAGLRRDRALEFLLTRARIADGS